MAQKFSSFLSQLDARQVDYRIGIITTDISSSATATTSDDSPNSALHNGNEDSNKQGLLQDGKLVPIETKNSSGAVTGVVGSYITSSMSNREQLFKWNISRRETEQCENFLSNYTTSPAPVTEARKNCPSGDERGIFAANLFLEKNPSSFIRPNAYLAIVVLSDEDERSGMYLDSSNKTYQLEDKDKPETLVSQLKQLYAGKSAAVHSIIVKPGDSSCLNSQSGQLSTYTPVRGSYGQAYAKASQLTGGKIGDICANDYGSQLSTIGADIAERLSDVTLSCEDPADLQVEIDPPQVSVTWTVSGTKLQFSQPLTPGIKVHLKYSCPSL